MGWVVHEEKKTQENNQSRRAPEMKQEAEPAKNKSDGRETKRKPGKLFKMDAEIKHSDNSRNLNGRRTLNKC